MNSGVKAEIIAYFSDQEAHFAPSQIDWAMNLIKGTAHRVIVDWWAEMNADGAERRRLTRE